MNKCKQQMPKSIIVRSQAEAIGDKLRARLREAQDAYATMRDGHAPDDYPSSRKDKCLLDLGELPRPEDITVDWLAYVIERKRKGIQQSDVLTTDEKTSKIGHVSKLHKKALPLVTTIQRFIESLPDGHYAFEEDVNNFYVKDINELIDDQARKDVPSEAATHWQLINTAMEAIDALRAFEEDHDCKKIRLECLRGMTAERLAEEWAMGSIKHLPMEYGVGARVSEQSYI